MPLRCTWAWPCSYETEVRDPRDPEELLEKEKLLLVHYDALANPKVPKKKARAPPPLEAEDPEVLEEARRLLHKQLEDDFARSNYFAKDPETGKYGLMDYDKYLQDCEEVDKDILFLPNPPRYVLNKTASHSERLSAARHAFEVCRGVRACVRACVRVGTLGTANCVSCTLQCDLWALLGCRLRIAHGTPRAPLGTLSLHSGPAPRAPDGTLTPPRSGDACLVDELWSEVTPIPPPPSPSLGPPARPPPPLTSCASRYCGRVMYRPAQVGVSCCFALQRACLWHDTFTFGSVRFLPLVKGAQQRRAAVATVPGYPLPRVGLPQGTALYCHQVGRVHMTAETQKAAKVETRVQILTGGYLKRSETLMEALVELHQQNADGGIDYACFLNLQQNEMMALKQRLEDLMQDVAVCDPRALVAPVFLRAYTRGGSGASPCHDVPRHPLPYGCLRGARCRLTDSPAAKVARIPRISRIPRLLPFFRHVPGLGRGGGGAYCGTGEIWPNQRPIFTVDACCATIREPGICIKFSVVFKKWCQIFSTPNFAIPNLARTNPPPPPHIGLFFQPFWHNTRLRYPLHQMAHVPRPIFRYCQSCGPDGADFRRS